MSDRREDHVRSQVELLGTEIGRLRATLPEATDSYTGFLAERLAVRVDIIDAAFWPTAAEWYRHFSGEGLAEDDAVAAALEVVDAHAATLRSALRLRP